MEPTNRSALAVANYLLDLADHAGPTHHSHATTNMKLNKLVYVAFGWWAGFHGKELFREPIEAWQWGPVIPIVYHEFKHLGSMPIPEGYRAIDDWDAEVARLSDSEQDAEVRLLLQYIWNSYGDLSGGRLMELTHADDTPWAQAFKGVRGASLDREVVREYYAERLVP